MSFASGNRTVALDRYEGNGSLAFKSCGIIAVLIVAPRDARNKDEKLRLCDEWLMSIVDIPMKTKINVTSKAIP